MAAQQGSGSSRPLPRDAETFPPRGSWEHRSDGETFLRAERRSQKRLGVPSHGNAGIGRRVQFGQAVRGAKTFRRRSGRGQPRPGNVSTRGKPCPTVMCGGHSTQRWSFSSLPPRRRNVLVPSRDEFMGDAETFWRGARCLPDKWTSLPLRNIGFEPRVRTCRRGDARMFPLFLRLGIPVACVFLGETFLRVWVRKRFPVSPVRGSGKRFCT